MTLKKLKAIYDDSQMTISYDKFLEIYEETTKEPYAFLYYDCTEQIFRKNFTEEINISDVNIENGLRAEIQRERKKKKSWQTEKNETG